MTLPAVTVIGRLTSDPELRWTASGLAVANFTIASNDRRKNAADPWATEPQSWVPAPGNYDTPPF